ncbi:MAG: hypothetical protein SFW66_03595 [Gammaproteobacteria bacterium]|nr:hypothetical protein [Gammaproteobacteria bacterium]
MISSTPIFYFPTKKLLLDDDKTFAQSVLLKMYGKNFIDFTSPQQALNFLNDEYKPCFDKNQLISFEESTATQQTISIQIDKIKQFFNTPYQQDISVVLVDYHMPEMLGTEFLTKIQHYPIKKILITGEHDSQIAINAFNNGLVNAYIRKDDPEFSYKIQSMVAELEWQYFTHYSQGTITNIPELQFLTNASFIQTFKQYIADNNISAFYLMDMYGSFCIHLPSGEHSYFLIRSRSFLNQLAESAKEDGASQETVKKIAEGKAIPFFADKNYWEISADQWDQYLYDAHPLPGDNDFVWTITQRSF